MTDPVSTVVGKPAPVRPGNKGERTRLRIKAAFGELLEVKSFATVTIADICRTSDITVGGFYFHFASQEELLDEVMAEYVGDLISDVRAAMAEARDDALAQAVCGAFVGVYSQRAGLARTFQQLTRMRSDYAARWRQASEKTIAQLGEILAQERPDLSDERARFLGYALIIMIMSKLDLVYVYQEHAAGAAGADRAALERELCVLWARMTQLQQAA
jgi:AcrR family transcriptional regulator